MATAGFCPNCGTARVADDAFCASCGSRLPDLQPPPADPTVPIPVTQPPAAASPPYQPPAQYPQVPPPAAPSYPPTAAYPQVPPATQPVYQPAPAASGPAVRVAGGVKMRPLPLIGAVVIAVAAALPWVDLLGRTANSFDIPMAFLFDPEGSAGGSGGINIGVVMVLLGVVGGLLTFVPITGALRRALGGLAIAVSGVYIAQWIRLASDAGGGATFTDFVGFGAYVGIAGGVLLAAGR